MANNDKNASALPGGEFLVYQTEDGRIKLEVRLEDENIWAVKTRYGRIIPV